MRIPHCLPCNAWACVGRRNRRPEAQPVSGHACHAEEGSARVLVLVSLGACVSCPARVLLILWRSAAMCNAEAEAPGNEVREAELEAARATAARMQCEHNLLKEQVGAGPLDASSKSQRNPSFHTRA